MAYNVVVTDGSALNMIGPFETKDAAGRYIAQHGLENRVDVHPRPFTTWVIDLKRTRSPNLSPYEPVRITT